MMAISKHVTSVLQTWIMASVVLSSLSSGYACHAQQPDAPKPFTVKRQPSDLVLDVLQLSPLKLAESTLKPLLLGSPSGPDLQPQPTDQSGKPNSLKLAVHELTPAALAQLKLTELPYGPLEAGVAARLINRIIETKGGSSAATQYTPQPSTGYYGYSGLSGISGSTYGLGLSLGLQGISTLSSLASLVTAGVQLEHGQPVNIGSMGFGGMSGLGGIGTGIQDFTSLTNSFTNLNLPGTNIGR